MMLKEAIIIMSQQLDQIVLSIASEVCLVNFQLHCNKPNIHA
jgi:hypothetical protein